MGRIMDKIISCRTCGERIKYHDEFVAGLMIILIMPFHTDCFARELKSTTTIILANEPINGVLGTFSAVVSGLGSLGVLILSPGLFKWFALPLALPALYRALTYVIFERHLYK